MLQPFLSWSLEQGRDPLGCCGQLEVLDNINTSLIIIIIIADILFIITVVVLFGGRLKEGRVVPSLKLPLGFAKPINEVFVSARLMIGAILRNSWSRKEQEGAGCH